MNNITKSKAVKFASVTDAVKQMLDSMEGAALKALAFAGLITSASHADGKPGTLDAVPQSVKDEAHAAIEARWLANQPKVQHLKVTVTGNAAEGDVSRKVSKSLGAVEDSVEGNVKVYGLSLNVAEAMTYDLTGMEPNKKAGVNYLRTLRAGYRKNTFDNLISQAKKAVAKKAALEALEAGDEEANGAGAAKAVRDWLTLAKDGNEAVRKRMKKNVGKDVTAAMIAQVDKILAEAEAKLAAVAAAK